MWKTDLGMAILSSHHIMAFMASSFKPSSHRRVKVHWTDRWFSIPAHRWDTAEWRLASRESYLQMQIVASLTVEGLQTCPMIPWLMVPYFCADGPPLLLESKDNHFYLNMQARHNFWSLFSLIFFITTWKHVWLSHVFFIQDRNQHITLGY